MRERKTSKVGQSNTIWGLILAFAMPFLTITATVPQAYPNEGMFARVARVVKSHRVFWIYMGAVVVIGGVAFGRKWKGGRVLADASDFGDLDQL
jgi:ABC-type Fe2+-enterobactin transport system substrate-binding protein